MFVIKSTTLGMLVNTYLKLDANWNVRSHCISYAFSQQNRRGNLEFFMRIGMLAVLILCCLDSIRR